ncbi:MAG: hypothetical protein U0798_14850 [Gemmataceae bacterium]
MNPEVPFSSNGIHKSAPEPDRKKVPMLIIGLIAIPLLLLIVVPLAWTIAVSTGTPVFNTVEELNVSEIDRFEIRLFNLKSLINSDQKIDDIGPYVAKPESYEKLLAPLKNAKAVDELPVKAFLGEYRIQMKDGRRQVIRLSFIPESDGTKQLAYKIGIKPFRAGNVVDLIKVVDASDPRPVK